MGMAHRLSRGRLHMASEQAAASSMNRPITRDRFDPKKRSEIQPLVIAPSAMPIGSAILAYIVFEEGLTWFTAIGGALILSAILLAARAEKQGGGT